MKTILFKITLAVGLVALATGCSEAKFESTSSSSSAKTSSASSSESDTTLDEVIEDGQIDPSEDALLNRNRCGNNRGDKKVNICHLPGGNIANAKTLCVSRNALGAHIGNHGDGESVDYIGKCEKDEGRECNDEDHGAEEEAGNL